MADGETISSMPQRTEADDLVELASLNDWEVKESLVDAWDIYASRRNQISEDCLYTTMQKAMRRPQFTLLVETYMNKLLKEAFFFYCMSKGSIQWERSMVLLKERIGKAEGFGFTNLTDTYKPMLEAERQDARHNHS